MSEQEATLSKRGQPLVQVGGARDGYGAILSDVYDATSNPNGYINIGTSENYAMGQVTTDYINSYTSFTAHDVTYGTGPWGSTRLRTAMARHMTKHFHSLHPVDPEDILISNGVTSLFEMLGFTIADPGDALLFSRPAYQAFEDDFGAKAGVKCIYVSFHGVDQFSPAAVPKYEAAIEQAQADGVKVRGLMVVNPMNPLGKCYERDTLIGLMRLCEKHKIHFLCDEVYALSTYDVPASVSSIEPVPFHSVLSFDTSPYIASTRLHVLYGLSKDFAASGLRIGCIYTRNKALMTALGATSVFHWSGPVTDKLAATMLEDDEWVSSYIAESRRRLNSRSALARQLLDEHGFKYAAGANAGFFLWVDLTPYLPKGIDGWEGEKDLVKRMANVKVFATSGESMHAEVPGWFRIIFSQEEGVLREGLKRLVEAVMGQETNLSVRTRVAGLD